MTERVDERKLTSEIFGREETPVNAGRKAVASIYHSIFLHNPVGNTELQNGIRKNLMKLISKEDLARFEREHK